MNEHVIATNLVRLRTARRLTQAGLAAAAGMTRAAYRAVEKGHALPELPALRALAHELEVPVRELVTPVPSLTEVRFRSLKRLKRRDQVLADVARGLRDLADLEALLGATRDDGLVAIRRGVADHAHDAVSAAVVARRGFGLGAREPVHDLCGLLESRGVHVLGVPVANDAFLGLSVGAGSGGPAIAVNTWSRLAVEHWIYSAAHELGHLLLHQRAYDVAETDEVDAEEKEAEAFASHFLMPQEAFAREWRDAAGWSLLDRVLKVKRVFRVSWRVVMYRATAGLPADQRRVWWQRIHAEHRRQTGRPLLKLTEPDGVDPSAFRAPPVASPGAEPARLDAHDFQGDRLARLVRTAVEEERVTLARAAEILGLSLAEMRHRAASWVG